MRDVFFCVQGEGSDGMREGSKGEAAALTSVILHRALIAGPLYTSSLPVMSLVRL